MYINLFLYCRGTNTFSVLLFHFSMDFRLNKQLVPPRICLLAYRLYFNVDARLKIIISFITVYTAFYFQTKLMKHVLTIFLLTVVNKLDSVFFLLNENIPNQAA